MTSPAHLRLEKFSFISGDSCNGLTILQQNGEFTFSGTYLGDPEDEDSVNNHWKQERVLFYHFLILWIISGSPFIPSLDELEDNQDPDMPLFILKWMEVFICI